MKNKTLNIINALKTLFCNMLFLILLSANFSFCFLLKPNTLDVNSSYAYEPTKITYAKALDNCMLYKTSSMSNIYNNTLFYIPETYFVCIVSKVSDDILKVLYNGYSGFCYSIKITPVTFEPISPYLNNISFDINQTSGTQLWSIPSASEGSKLSTIPAGTTNLEYIACTTGEIPLGGTINIWYYARYTPINFETVVYEGYIYSEATTSLSNIPNNLEVENVPSSDPPEQTIDINETLKAILIVLICLPFLILFIVGISKIFKQVREKKLKHQPLENSICTKTNSVPILIKKKPLKLSPKNTNEDESVEILFPEYDFIDDDDLL